MRADAERVREGADDEYAAAFAAHNRRALLRASMRVAKAEDKLEVGRARALGKPRVVVRLPEDSGTVRDLFPFDSRREVRGLGLR